VFTQQHYIKIAKLLKKHSKEIPSFAQLSFNVLVQDLVVMLEKDNKKFDVERFLDAIYGKEKK